MSEPMQLPREVTHPPEKQPGFALEAVANISEEIAAELHAYVGPDGRIQFNEETDQLLSKEHGPGPVTEPVPIDRLDQTHPDKSFFDPAVINNYFGHFSDSGGFLGMVYKGQNHAQRFARLFPHLQQWLEVAIAEDDKAARKAGRIDTGPRTYSAPTKIALRFSYGLMSQLVDAHDPNATTEEGQPNTLLLIQ